MGEDHFVLKNSAVQMTIAGGRITSLFDVALEYVHRKICMPRARGTLTHLPLIAASLSPRARREAW